jgi:hypothetical protein
VRCTKRRRAFPAPTLPDVGNPTETIFLAGQRFDGSQSLFCRRKWHYRPYKLWRGLLSVILVILLIPTSVIVLLVIGMFFDPTRNIYTMVSSVFWTIYGPPLIVFAIVAAAIGAAIAPLRVFGCLLHSCRATLRARLAEGPQISTTVRGGEDYEFGSFSLKVIPSIHSPLDHKHYFSSATAPAGMKAPLTLEQIHPEGGTLAYLIRFHGH